MRFTFSTLDEIPDIARKISDDLPPEYDAYLGICELMINAIEHGNLMIGYAEKSNLIREDRWRQECERRLGLPEFASREACISRAETTDSWHITITDQGHGFDFQQVLASTAGRLRDVHGRGLIICQSVFDALEYHGIGNAVTARILK